MKRSEMINKLEDVFLDFDGVSIGMKDSTQLANLVLDFIQKEGMLPPSYVYWNAPLPYLFLEGETVPEGLQQSMDNGDDLNKWEPENE